MILRKSQGQSTLEYIILVGGIVAFFAYFVAKPASEGGYFQTRLTEGHTEASDGIVKLSGRLKASYDSAPAATDDGSQSGVINPIGNPTE